MNIGLLQAKFSTRFDNNEVGCGELAQICGLTEQRIIQLTREGMPKNGRGSYPLRECCAYYIRFQRKMLEENKSETIVAEKLRFMRARATCAEVDAKIAGGAVLDVEKARQEIMALTIGIKDALLGIPGRIAHELTGQDAGQIKLKLTEVITTALTKAADKLENYANSVSAASGSISTEDKALPECGGVGEAEQDSE
jgi:phage terminase Nu1 subunit (DNA packaging protein)